MNKEQRPESFEVGTYCATLQKHLSMVPELEPGLKLMAKDLEYTTSVYTDYASLINYTAYLSEPERKTVKDAKSFMVQTKGSFGTASQLSVDELFDELGDHTDILAVLAVNANDVSGPYFEPAIDELAKRMEGGHRLKAEGKQPSDGDPESQKVIWGHTMISDPKALVNFIICHHLERFIATGLTAQGYESSCSKRLPT